MFDFLQLHDPSIKFRASRLERRVQSKELLGQLINFFEEVVLFYGIQEEEALNIHNLFLESQQEAAKYFIQTGEYKSTGNQQECNLLSRKHYDFILALSFCIELHRYKIIEWLLSHELSKDIVSIGSGVGVELLCIYKAESESIISSYDINFSPFLHSRYEVQKKENEFSQHVCLRQNTSVLAVELIEHLSCPEEFITLLSKTLVSGNKLLITTAINCPQFDHITNFKEKEILKLLREYSFHIEDYVVIEHSNVLYKTGAKSELISCIKK